MNKFWCASAVTAAVIVAAHAAESLYVLGADGSLIGVDTTTFAATSSVQTGATHGTAEMAFGADGMLYLTNLFSVERYDISTGTLDTVLTTSVFTDIAGGVFNTVTTDWQGGLVVGVNGYVSGSSGPPVNRFYSFDPGTPGSSPGLLFQPQGLGVPVFDVAYTGPTSALGALWSQGQIVDIDTTTGAYTVLNRTIRTPVSFFTLGSQLHVLTESGAVYTLDATTGEATFVASITGVSGSLIGAAVIPAPGVAGVLAFGGVFATRRRR